MRAGRRTSSRVHAHTRTPACGACAAVSVREQAIDRVASTNRLERAKNASTSAQRAMHSVSKPGTYIMSL